MQEECYICKGRGVIPMQAVEIGEGGERIPLPIVEIGCVVCNGTGKVGVGSKEAWDNFWCRCDEVGDGIYYHDGEHPDCFKHHWRCSKCGRVIQVG